MRVSLAFVATVSACASSQQTTPACESSSDCSIAAPRCSTETSGETNECIGCVGDVDCTRYSDSPRCAPEGVCVGCIDSSQCENPAPVCDTARTCRECRADSECASQVCDVDAGTCVAPTAIVYASPEGSDMSTCTMTAPCTIARAVTMADPLRRWVRLLPGTYAGAVTISGNDRMFSLVGSAATLTGAPSANALAVNGGANVIVRGLTIAPEPTSGAAAVRCSATTGITTLVLRELAVTPPIPSATTIQAQSCQITLDRVTVPTAGASALTVNTNATAYVDRSILHGDITLSGTGIALSMTSSVVMGSLNLANLGGATNVRVSFSTFIDAVQACDASQLQPTITFSNNIFLGPLDATDAITGRKCTFDHNLAFPQSTNLGLYTTRADPMLVNAAAADFHLLAGSPAIDAADPAAATMPDFDGTPRPQGARADLGAFESK